MSAAAGLDLASIPERVQSEVQRAILRSVKGVEYLSTSGPTLGSTPKEILHTREVLNNILANHTGQPIDRIAKDTDRDFYMTAEQAKEYGVVDDILTKQALGAEEDEK